MTLGFSTNWPDKRPTLFPEKIMYPYVADIRDNLPDLIPKIHTFRLGNRWRAGMKIHMVTGNRTPQRHQFNTHIPELHKCFLVQPAVVLLLVTGIRIGIGTIERYDTLNPRETLLFAANDGFNSIEEMERWFFPRGAKSRDKSLEGQVIHWTDFRYSPDQPARDDWYADPGRSGYVDL